MRTSQSSSSRDKSDVANNTTTNETFIAQCEYVHYMQMCQNWKSVIAQEISIIVHTLKYNQKLRPVMITAGSKLEEMYTD